jgi:hypothetical protein
MKSLFLFIIIANTAYGQSGYTISNRTGTTRSIVSFNLPNFRGTTTSTTSSTSGTTSTSTPRYADDPVAAFIEDPTSEIRVYTPREIGYAEPVYSFPVTADIAPALSEDTTILGATTTRAWSRYSATIDYTAPLESAMYSGGTLFSGVEDTWSGTTAESWSSATVDYSGTTVRADTSTATTSTATSSTSTVAVISPATTTATVSTSSYTNINFVEPTPAPAPDPVPVFSGPATTEIVPVVAPVSTTPVTSPVVRGR